MHDFLIAEGEHRAPGTMLWPFSCLSVLSLPGPNGDGRLHSCVTCSSSCCCFYNLVFVVIVVDRNVLASSSCLNPSLLGFPRDGEDSLLVYQEEESSRILDFFEKRFSFLLRGVSLNFLIKEFQLVVMM